MSAHTDTDTSKAPEGIVQYISLELQICVLFVKKITLCLNTLRVSIKIKMSDFITQ